MKSRTRLLILGALAVGTSPVFANDLGLQGSVGVDANWGSTKIGTPSDGDVRRNEEVYPAIYGSLIHEVPYLPNVKLRYTQLETEYISHDKFDYTFFWRSFRSDVLKLDLGFTFSDYRNSEFIYDKENNIGGDFDDTIFSWYANGEIHFPGTNLAMIGEFDFGETDLIKTADVMAGMQYTLPIEKVDLAIRGGYRVLDYTFYEYHDKNSTGFVDGWFLGLKADF
jgi:outer membrane protein